MPDFKAIQDKWQQKWEQDRVFEVTEDPKKKKFYCLEMFPYPSASFLHMGHVRNDSIADAVARYKRLNGYNVLYPVGFDSFGLPAENAAKKQKIHPREYTESAIIKITKYLKELGLSYDWSRLIATHRPEYYKWNQYFFIKFFEKGLVYRKKAPVNFCNSCNTVLANEEVEQGKCWRCGNEVVQKELDQWFFKTTAYTKELLQDLDRIDWSDKLKSIQRNWIGESTGVMINFKLDDGSDFPIFTTRPDTIFGVTFMVIALDHPKLMSMVHDPYRTTVESFIKEVKDAQAKEDNEFLEKNGVFTGRYVVNPLNNEKVPLYAGNFVVADYATGAIMAVPAHDQRDYEFAKKYGIAIKTVIADDTISQDERSNISSSAYTGPGKLINSAEFNGLANDQAVDKITAYIEKKSLGHKKVNYKLKDWLISRQRYWGTPIPMIFCDRCGIVPVPENQLPLLLPEDVVFEDKGNPLLTSKTFTQTKCPKCHADARRETDTMGGFMDSSWYFLRYCSPHTTDVPFDKQAVKYWMPVDQYVGGIEHAVGHLIYSRFFTKALRDMGMIEVDEPFNSLFNQGIVYKDGAKMSKSHGNIVTQDDIALKYGIDTARVFMLFVASPEKEMEWNDKGVEGSFKFITRIMRLYEEQTTSRSSKKDTNLISRKNMLIRDVTSHIDEFRLNAAVLSLMEFCNYLNEVSEDVSAKTFKDTLADLAILLNPFMPHISEECWHMLGYNTYSSKERWPGYDESLINAELHYMEELFDSTKKDIHSVLQLAKIDKPSQITLFVSPAWKYDLYTMVKQQLSSTRHQADIIKHVMSSELKKHGQDIMKIVPKIIEKMPEHVLSQQEELGFFESNKDALSREFDCEINIVAAEQSNEGKAKNASPGKLAILAK